ncbi:MAG: GNAT family N-acetyltransferase [Acidobacteria bacterium]|nr:GNAT family N-acetyltransferase [Acidobacteriota bacterium]
MPSRLTTRVLTGPADWSPWAPAWDALAASRGPHSDLFDSAAWLAAWTAADPDAARRLRLVAAIETERLVAALPLVAHSSRRWGAAGLGFRPRFRPALEGEAPRPETLEALVTAVAAQGVRELSLPALPTRDPATDLLHAALRGAGFAVERREGAVECFTPVGGDFAEHARAFKKFARTVSNFTNKGERLGTWELTAHGLGRGDAATVAGPGFETYRAVHARGWKGPLREPMLSFRRALLERTAALGWARTFQLSLAGIPAAAMIWFRVGPVAVAYSTVYDERMAAISPGTIAMWRAHEAIFAETVPLLIDYLPGRGAQKDQLGTERPPLVTLEATRRGPIGSALARANRPLRAVAARLRRRPRSAASFPAEPDATPRTVEPAAEARVPVAPLELDPYAELFLAVAGGHASPQKLRESWQPDDAWWRIGAPALALARLGSAGGPAGSPTVREVVALTDDGPALDAALAALARHAGRTLEVTPRRAPLPWTAG